MVEAWVTVLVNVINLVYFSLKMKGKNILKISLNGWFYTNYLDSQNILVC